MEDNIIKSSFDKAHVSKNLNEKINKTVEENQKTRATKKTTTSKKATAPKTEKQEPKKQDNPSQVAVHSDGKLAHPALGRLDKGYNIVTPAQAEEWMKISNKVRMATPEEVAIAYGA